MSTLDVKAHDKCTKLSLALGETLGTKLAHYINVFLHTDLYKNITEEKRQIGLELQETRMKLSKEEEQHEKCRRELLETHQELKCKF